MDTAAIDQSISTRYRVGKAYFEGLFSSGKLPACCPGYQAGNCSRRQHYYAAPMLCGKEYCPDCGRDGSPIHARRFARWQEAIGRQAKLGYFVFTFPKNVRFLLMDKAALAAFRYAIRRKLRREGFTSGLARWHFFGDCEHCQGLGCTLCRQTGASREWHPHLNILVNKGYLAPSVLAQLIKELQTVARNFIRRLIREHLTNWDRYIEKWKLSTWQQRNIKPSIDALKELLRCKENYVIDYSYTSTPSKIANRLKYVLRSTWRHFDAELKDTLHNFRNCTRWGFPKSKEKMIQDCPACAALGIKSAMRWHGIEQFNPLNNYSYEQKGVYRIHQRKESNFTGLHIQNTRSRAPAPKIIPRASL